MVVEMHLLICKAEEWTIGADSISVVEADGLCFLGRRGLLTETHVVAIAFVVGLLCGITVFASVECHLAENISAI